MKQLLYALSFLMLCSSLPLLSQDFSFLKSTTDIDKVQSLKDTLTTMLNRNENTLFKNHCKSFVDVIDAQTELTTDDTFFLSAAYDVFCDNADEGNPRILNSYLNRQRSLVFAWQSPTDGVVSFSTLLLPKDWDPEKSYPVYIQLHGLWNVANSPIEYMTYSFRNGPSSSFAYDDGYSLSPWGRGNLWYEGISETDIWECKAELERLVKIDEKRQYITGHSMGGYGAWYIASRSADIWAALGVHAGALWYNNEKLLDNEVIHQLKDLPTYFVCGTNDGLLDVDQRAYNLLNVAGNEHTEFVTFEGGHEYVQTNVENMYMWLKDFVNEDYTLIADPLTLKEDNLNCFPNPFTTSTQIRFNLENSGFVMLSIYNSEGRLIETLINNTLPQGIHEIKYTPSTEQQGLYVCILKIEEKQFQHKILLIK